MDSERFDAWTRGVGNGASRRRVLRALLGGALAAPLALALALGSGRSGAQPGCRQAGNPCEGNQDCCAGLVCRRSGPGSAARCTRPPTPTPTPIRTPTPVPRTPTPTPTR